MFKSFHVWLEQKDTKNLVKKFLLDRLGLEDDTVKIRQVDRNRLKKALEAMNMEDEKFNNVAMWLKTAPDSRLMDLVNQIGDVPMPEEGGEEEQQGADGIAGQPAELPEGQPRPPRNPMQQSGMENLPPPGQM